MLSSRVSALSMFDNDDCESVVDVVVLSMNLVAPLVLSKWILTKEMQSGIHEYIFIYIHAIQSTKGCTFGPSLCIQVGPEDS